MATSTYCVPCTTLNYGTTKTANPSTAKRITTTKSQKQTAANPTTARWTSSSKVMNTAVSKKTSASNTFTCPTNYMQSSTAQTSATVQQSANKTYTNSYGMARNSSSGGNRFTCYG